MAHDASRRKEEDVTQTPSSSLPRHRPHRERLLLLGENCSAALIPAFASMATVAMGKDDTGFTTVPTAC